MHRSRTVHWWKLLWCVCTNRFIRLRMILVTRHRSRTLVVEWCILLLVRFHIFKLNLELVNLFFLLNL